MDAKPERGAKAEPSTKGTRTKGLAKWIQENEREEVETEAEQMLVEMLNIEDKAREARKVRGEKARAKKARAVESLKMEMQERMKLEDYSEGESKPTPTVDKNYGFFGHTLNDPAFWQQRYKTKNRYVHDSPVSEYKRELELLGAFAEQHPNNDCLFWDYRRLLVEKIGSEAANKELEFTKRLLSKNGTKNYQAWSHREWVIHNFDKRSLWLPELEYCREVLEKDKFNISVWDQICRAARYSDLDDGMRLREAVYAKEAIRAHPGNEGPWMYLKVLYAQHKESLYTNPELECIYVDVLSDEVDRVKLAMVFDPDYDMACATLDKRGCVHALNLIADLVVVAGYDVINNAKVVDAVKFFFAYSRPPFPWVDPVGLWQMDRKGIFGIVCAAAFALDACRIRYCYMYHGFYWFRDHHIYFEEKGKSPIELEDLYNNTLCDDPSPHSAERLDFERFIASLCQPEFFFEDIFTLYPEWKKCLFETYLHKRTRFENDDNMLEEDLKWDLRRCVVKYKGTNDAALDELECTTKIINDDAYNRRAWSHRQWVFETFGGDWEDSDEFKFCDEILKKDTCNSFAWDQRYFLITRWVPKIQAAKGPNMDEGSALFEKVVGFEESFESKRVEEMNYAIEFIEAEPENQFPWSHIIGLHMAYPGVFEQIVKVRDAIMRVLEGARLGVLGLDLSDGIMGGGGSHYANNARGITNALNMLLDIILNHEYPRFCTSEEYERFSRVIDDLCPDSCLPDQARKRDILKKSTIILRQMDTTLPYAGLSWINVIDQLIDGGGL